MSYVRWFGVGNDPDHERRCPFPSWTIYVRPSKNFQETTLSITIQVQPLQLTNIEVCKTVSHTQLREKLWYCCGKNFTGAFQWHNLLTIYRSCDQCCQSTPLDFFRGFMKDIVYANNSKTIELPLGPSLSVGFWRIILTVT